MPLPLKTIGLTPLRHDAGVWRIPAFLAFQVRPTSVMLSLIGRLGAAGVKRQRLVPCCRRWNAQAA
jgi:hypothetical protein